MAREPLHAGMDSTTPAVVWLQWTRSGGKREGMMLLAVTGRHGSGSERQHRGSNAVH